MASMSWTSLFVLSFLGALVAAPATTSTAAAAAATPEFAGEKTISHLHFYFHDLRGGPNATSLEVVGLGKASGFGDIGVFDNVLTEGPVMGSKVVGKGQGSVVVVQLDGQAVMTSLNFVFTGGEHNGSSLALFGRAALSAAFSERSIVGGTGAFRGARGYAISSIVSASQVYLIAEFNVYVSVAPY